MTLILTEARNAHLERHGRVRGAVAPNLPAIVVNIADGVVLTDLLADVSHQSSAAVRARERGQHTLLTPLGRILSLEYAVLDAVC